LDAVERRRLASTHNGWWVVGGGVLPRDPRLRGLSHRFASLRYNGEMHKVSIIVLVAAACFGQTPPAPEKAPPDTDAALRARITQFYQLEVEGKFSQAYELVAADTKDMFIGSSKPTYTGFEINSITYYDNLTKAEVMLIVTRLMPIQGFMGHPLATKMKSRWKIENGQWCYFVDPQKDLPTSPFGGLPVPGMGGPNMIPNASPGAAAVRPPPLPDHLADYRMLTPDKQKVQLKASGTSSEQVTIPNTSPFQLTLVVADPKVPGLMVDLSPRTVAPRRKAILTIRSSGRARLPKTPVTVMITVAETKQQIPIQLSFAE